MKTRRSHVGPVAVAAVTCLTFGSAAMAVGRSHLTIVGCGQHSPMGGVAPNHWPAARRELAPPGASGIRLCRYSGLNARPPLSLQGSALVRSARTRHRLVKRLDALPAPAPIAACPSDSGAAIVAHLVYPHGHRVTVRLGLDGCRGATNGDVWRTAAGSVGDRLIAQLERLTDPPHH